MSTTQGIEYEDVIKKEARGTNDDDLGEVQDIGQTYVMTQKGTFSKEKFFLPKYLIEGYDGDVLRFRISKEEARSKFVRDTPPTDQDYSRYRTSDIPKDIETRIPVMG
jgi:hypothetical protein